MILSRIVLGLALAAHPLHSTHTELREERGGGVSLTVRAFTDDLHGAVRAAEGGTGDSALARYVRRSLRITGPAGQPVALEWRGARTDGNVTYLLLAGALPGGLRGARIQQVMLMERYSDQVNVVQVRTAAGATSLLFLPGQGPKVLP
ncbi:MAG: DUF6702 family protein [Gemmatimonadota bacterium]|nr:DUF6702 family protein [Gemmatimonadota bacterium]